ncbi:MFS transporter [Rahnella woolbedingensis]|uniref:MFS transporter n=1 Tax=Rahnella woolbedingensis TaxID=1510574 RepID=A0A419N6Y4_9GAMM|nr:MFS transporter [Rahnella woolbedingensis]RJT42966.1 MFS transporter [Rahnella woolbedingensis]
MNSLLHALIRALRSHRWLRLLGCAFILSSLGNGLTQVVVFGQLLRWQASPATLTLAYMLATLPGFLGSLWGERLCRNMSPLRILILCEILGMLALIMPLYGVLTHNITALLAVQSAEALFSGMSYPALTLLFKRGLSAEELPAATALETLIFAAQVLLGTGLGVLLFDVLSPLSLLTLDALSFAASAALLAGSLAHFTVCTPHDSPPKKDAEPPLHWKTFTPLQKRSVLLLPALAAVGSPAMALLPALAQQMHTQDTASLALPLLFARSLGQLCGPLLLNANKLRHYSASNLRLLVCLMLFLAGYFLLPHFALWPFAALTLIFGAHLASNVVFALGTFGVLSHFQGADVARASALAWRGQVFIAAIATGIAGYLAENAGAAIALHSVSLTSLAGVAILLWRYRV